MNRLETSARRNAILKLLYSRQHDTIRNIAFEFGVSERTIRRDIEVLSLTAPIYTLQGRYNGGVYIMPGFYLDRVYFSETQSAVIHKVLSLAENGQKCLLTGIELATLKEIEAEFTNPTVKKDRRI